MRLWFLFHLLVIYPSDAGLSMTYSVYKTLQDCSRNNDPVGMVNWGITGLNSGVITEADFKNNTETWRIYVECYNWQITQYGFELRNHTYPNQVGDGSDWSAFPLCESSHHDYKLYWHNECYSFDKDDIPIDFEGKYDYKHSWWKTSEVQNTSCSISIISSKGETCAENFVAKMNFNEYDCALSAMSRDYQSGTVSISWGESKLSVGNVFNMTRWKDDLCTIPDSPFEQDLPIGKCFPTNFPEFSNATTSIVVEDYHCDQSQQIGFDLSVPLTPTILECLKSTSYSQYGRTGFIVARLYRSSGKVDAVGIKNLVLAAKAGFDVHGYIFPCVAGKSAVCGNAKQQILDVALALSSSIPNIPLTQWNIWLDIESNGNGFWSKDKEKNQEFVKDLMAEASNLGIKQGIYAKKSDWDTILGDFDAPKNLGLPLWYAHYDKKPDFSDFVPFGGWDRPEMKQFVGDVNVCGIGVDVNWKK